MNEKTTRTAKVSATRVRAASRAPNATAVNPAQLTVHNHPLARRHYRVATAAIEGFVDLVERCVRVLIPGALIYALLAWARLTQLITWHCTSAGIAATSSC